jgi:simple sugar transport system substrate-binding protein
MPDDVKALAIKTVADITTGKNKIFVGPLTDQSGKLQLPAGKTMDDGQLSSLQWLVEGIQGKLS